uniref:protein ENHANCED DISEASE RESISTANCE 2-like n=1 Tax=Erigeron canadensis TaxID=72917 RepID=UPI001CB90953|nr:protein ENHANCED DISEASE RESISTANCE 2-like [Erigeron canadensis]
MIEELNSMKHNDVWDLVELPEGSKPTDCKWVFKTKLDPNGNVEHYKARLMDVKTAFLNGDLEEDVYMWQPEGFIPKGIEIHRDRRNGVLGLSQRAYIDRILERYKMQDCSPTIAPVVKGDVFGSFQTPSTEIEKEQMRVIPYASVVGSIMYAQVCTRPDIAYIAGMLGRYLSNPGLAHWKAAKKVLRYMQGTKDYKLTFRRSDDLEVVGYSDSDFAKSKEDKKSTSGYIFMLAGGPISWWSHKQKLTATSTMMAEYIAVYNATCHGMLLRNLVSGLKIVNSISRPLKLYCDNLAAVTFSNSNSSTGAGLLQKNFVGNRVALFFQQPKDQKPETELLCFHTMDLSLESDEQRIMEGWLYLIRSNKFGFQHLRKRYYVLQNRQLKSFKSIPHSLHTDPVRSAVLKSCIGVTDNGRKSILGKAFFIFTLCGISSNASCVKLGARNPEEAARWVEAFQEVSLKMNQRQEDFLDWAKCKPQHSRSKSRNRVHVTNSIDKPFSLAAFTGHKTAAMSSYLTIFGCHNGLRLFKEVRNHEDQKKMTGHSVVAALSVIDGDPEAVFQILMSLGSSRSEWDFCFQKGSVIESINGRMDIVHELLKDNWLPWGMKPRDLLLQRYWCREDDGTYIILYHSVHHKYCPPQKNHVRACIKSGGYVISPTGQLKQSVVRHILDIDWKVWRSYLQKCSDQSLSVHMIGRLAALREFFKTNLASYLSEGKDFTSMSVTPQSSEIEECMKNVECELSDPHSDRLDLVEMDYESDEFFDVPETFGDVQFESVNCDYVTLTEDRTGNLPNSWSVPEPSLFQLRGETFHKDRKKVTAKSTLMQTVAIDWLRSDKREDNIAAREGSIVQKFAADGRPEFFVVLNLQMPGSTTYSIAGYYMTSIPIKDIPLLEKFVEGDDAFRNSRFKLIPHITKGPWVLKKISNRATLVGQLLKVNYIRGKNYIELDIDVGSSALARGLAGTALSCFSSLIVETGFVIQANTRDELPEQLYGAARLNHVDVSRLYG